MTDHRTIMAAHNNADWYTMMFDVHGLQYSRSEIAFLAIDPPPPFHSWMTSTDPAAQVQLLQLISENKYRPRFGVKDAFDCLNLANEGLNKLFSATWIYADAIQAVDTANWIKITSPSDLLLWETAWKDDGSPPDKRQFPDTILDRSDVAVWGRKDSSRFDAGVIANVSTNCLGLSNCFGQGAFHAAASLCAELAKGLPVVGYERGDDLADALAAGFTATGTLSVWAKAA